MIHSAAHLHILNSGGSLTPSDSACASHHHGERRVLPDAFHSRRAMNGLGNAPCHGRGVQFGEARSRCTARWRPTLEEATSPHAPSPALRGGRGAALRVVRNLELKCVTQMGRARCLNQHPQSSSQPSCATPPTGGCTGPLWRFHSLMSIIWFTGWQGTTRPLLLDGGESLELNFLKSS